MTTNIRKLNKELDNLLIDYDSSNKETLQQNIDKYL